MTDSTPEKEYYSKVSESLKDLVELYTRTDERVKMMIEKQNHFDKRLEVLNDIAGRVLVLENKSSSEEIAKLQEKAYSLDLELKTLLNSFNKVNTKWDKVVDFAWKIAFIVIAGWIALKLELPL